MSIIGGPLPGQEKTKEEQEESLNKALETTGNIAKSLVPDLTDPAETAEYFVDLGSHVNPLRGNPIKGGAFFVGKKIVSELPEVQKAYRLAREIIDPSLKKVQTFLDKDHFEPIYDAVGAGGDNVGTVARNVDNLDRLPNPAQPLQIASNLSATPHIGKSTYGTLRTLVREGSSESLVKARSILESGWGGKLSKNNTRVSIDKLVGTEDGRTILNRMMDRSEAIEYRFDKYNKKLARKAKSTELTQRELYDIAAKNLYDASELIYGQKGARKYLSQVTKWFTKDEWHHIFGNKEAGEFLLSQVAQDPVVAINLFKKMDELNLFSSGIAKNIAVMKQKPHKALHRWYVKHGFQGGAADFGELGRELGEAIVASKADVNDLFRMLELHADFNKHVRGLIKGGKFGKYGDEVKLLDEVPEGVGKALQIGGYRAKGPSKPDAWYRSK